MLARAPRLRMPEARTAQPGEIGLEIHFGKPVVAKVRKCRTVVVRNKRQTDEDKK